jgi:hypothetical protein
MCNFEVLVFFEIGLTLVSYLKMEEPMGMVDMFIITCKVLLWT